MDPIESVIKALKDPGFTYLFADVDPGINYKSFQHYPCFQYFKQELAYLDKENGLSDITLKHILSLWYWAKNTPKNHRSSLYVRGEDWEIHNSVIKEFKIPATYPKKRGLNGRLMKIIIKK